MATLTHLLVLNHVFPDILNGHVKSEDIIGVAEVLANSERSLDLLSTLTGLHQIKNPIHALANELRAQGIVGAKRIGHDLQVLLKVDFYIHGRG